MRRTGCDGAVVLRLVTYNVHGGVGSDGRYDPGRVAAVIRDLDADAVALQEVDSRRHPGGPESQLAFLAAETALSSVAGPTLADAAGTYGNAVLTRLPVRRCRHWDLSVPGREPRGALDLELGLGSGQTGEGVGVLRLVTTHLGLARHERRLQAGRLASVVGDDPAELPLAVVGDVNDWVPWWGAARRLRRVLGRDPLRRSFPARWPILPLDRIWVRPADALVSCRAHLTPRSRDASDHLPLVAELHLPGSRGLDAGRGPVDSVGREP